MKHSLYKPPSVRRVESDLAGRRYLGVVPFGLTVAALDEGVCCMLAALGYSRRVIMLSEVLAELWTVSHGGVTYSLTSSFPLPVNDTNDFIPLLPGVVATI
jgi:hypothetical protein